MKEVKLTFLLETLPIIDHPRWLRIWEDEEIDYLVAFRRDGKTILEAVGPKGKVKTLAKALQEKSLGLPVSFTPSMHFTLRSLEYKKDELEGRILLLRTQEKEMQDARIKRPLSTSLERPTTRQTPEELSQKERDLQVKDIEIRRLTEQLQRERTLLDEQALFIEETEARLNEHFERISQREAEIEQKEDELRRKAFRLGIAL